MAEVTLEVIVAATPAVGSTAAMLFTEAADSVVAQPSAVVEVASMAEADSTVVAVAANR